MNYVPEQGDIVWLDFDSSSGKEIMKRRPAFVISKRIFNAHLGMAVVAPITSTIRQVKLEVVLPKAMKTQGAILVYQFKSIDFSVRNLVFIESSPSYICDQVSSIAQLIVQTDE